ncbi:ArsR/SmtB family transcription factor [Kribbella sp. NBC_00889]|uniref:ArsR/SmtB family transcription factor n=1 Tax=Kribbella sp. NBC_00889 TaxID=2975974 RepID=UPI0038642FCC
MRAPASHAAVDLPAIGGEFDALPEAWVVEGLGFIELSRVALAAGSRLLQVIRCAGNDRFSAVERRRRRGDATAAESEVRRVSRPLYQVKAEFFKTLGHPARIRVLELLSERDHSVAEILSDVGIEATSLSQQLAVLRRSGLVSTRKQGSTVIYSLTSPDITELLRVARTILTGMLSGQVELLEDLQEPLAAPQPDR